MRSQPNWNTAVITPNAAAAESMFMIAAVAGITRLRNTAISSRNDSSTTTPMNSGSLLESTLAKSAKIAVCPPIRTCTPLPALAVGHDRVTQRDEQVAGRGGLRRADRVHVGGHDARPCRRAPGT